MGADRLIREPTVMAEGEETVEGPEGVRVLDPLADHWLGAPE